jgi:hypothetical protein
VPESDTNQANQPKDGMKIPNNSSNLPRHILQRKQVEKLNKKINFQDNKENRE